MKHEKSCGAVIFRRYEGNEQALLIRHKNSSAWSFPKGHVEQGEAEADTALREIREETGLGAVQLDVGFRETLEYFAKANVRKRVVFFVGYSRNADDTPPRVRDDIVQEARWENVSLVPGMLAFENHRVLFDHALSYFRARRPEN